MTYKQAYDKIIEAYFKDEIRPNEYDFCFCGTLAGNRHWTDEGDPNYSGAEYSKMELALFSSFPETKITYITGPCFEDQYAYHPETTILDYEDKLFAGMSAALDVLKQIHIDRGEIIDEPIPFTQRQLV